ncbi:glycoside hydrolase [Fusarium albosuccineum]|uniref:Glycoside hydrolase n=1 Tax=Fusarium albosuccineum TaxID=1237068 RepID=A0A8H4PGY1_9HYPO|nr:glycoside hydrolase [Fusarium albosuccineum]
MIAKKLTLLTATAALLEPALALSHRHMHQRVQKRAEWITATIDGQVVSWENNYFGPGGAAPAATQAAEQPASQPESLQADAPAAVPASQTTIVKVVKPAKASEAAEAPKKAVYKEETAESTKTTSSSKSKSGSSKSSTASSGSSSSGGSVGFSSKRGVAYNDIDLANTFAGDCDNCGWGYNWDSESYGLKNLNFIPTLWSADANHVDRFPDNVQTCLSNGAKAIFSFNEPDNGGQANMQPADAAAAHVKYLNKYAGKALIGAPSISNSGLAGEGIEWLTSFVSACESQETACHYDFCNVHWYSEVEYGETLFDHLKAAHKTCGGKPIWLTEFAPKGSDEAIASWLEEAIPRLEALEYLDAYAYWMVSEGILMSSATELSTYGKVYAQA